MWLIIQEKTRVDSNWYTTIYITDAAIPAKSEDIKHPIEKPICPVDPYAIHLERLFWWKDPTAPIVTEEIAAMKIIKNNAGKWKLIMQKTWSNKFEASKNTYDT